jgi:tetratricopeptide (TPR) repeat protein
MTACDEVASLLALEGVAALAPELLDPEERAPLAAHLAGCAACSARSAAFAGAVATLDEPGPAVPAAFDAVLARLAAGEDPALADEADGTLKILPGDEGALPAPAVKLVIALGCTYCHDALLRVDATYCASCLAPHHGECHQAHGRCAAPGCEETRVVRPLDGERPAPRRRGWGTALAGGTAAAAVLLGGIAALVPVRVKPRPADLRAATPTPVPELPPRRAEVSPIDSRPPTLDELLKRAASLLEHRTGDERGADLVLVEAALEEAFRQDLDSLPALRLLGRLRMQQGNLVEALAAFDRALAVDPRSARTYLDRAEVLGALGRADEAARDLARGRELDPTARVVQAQVQRYEGPKEVVVSYGPELLRVGDTLAIRRGGRIVVRLTVVELLGSHSARCEEELLVAGASVEELDAAVLVTDEAVWGRARERFRREQVLQAIERRREAGGIRVLYLEATAGRSWSAAQDALLRSRSLDVRTWLVTEDPSHVQRASAGADALKAAPVSFQDFDVVIVGGDVPAALVPAEAIQRFLRTGGGLVLLPGQEGRTADVGAVDRPWIASGHDPRPVTRLTFSEGLTNVNHVLGVRDTFELPPLFGVQAATPRAGARILAQDEGGRPLVALATAADGVGRVVQIGADDLWRWETAEGGEELLQVFWLEVVGAASGEVWRPRGGDARR